MASRSISLIIPLKRDQGWLRPCLEACFQYAGRDIEVIVLPDEPLAWNDPRLRVEPTGPARPARKRNRGAALARGDILVFLDDDTRPLAGWLDAALPHFEDPRVAAVGGPSVTPPDDPFWAQVSGAAYESWLMSGDERRRYVPGAPAEVHDWPSCNLLVRRTAFEEVGGFGTDFWPGEDTAFCLALVQRGHVIRYEPRAVIEHHRRPSLARHFVQLANYGLHRGHFAKRYPETSRRLPYFVPSLMVMTGAVLLALAVLGCAVAGWALAALVGLHLALGATSLAKHPTRLILPSACVILLSHAAYGVSFLRGLIVSRLPEEKDELRMKN